MSSGSLNHKHTIRVLKTIKEVQSIRPVWEAWQWHPNADIDFFLTIVDVRPEIHRPHVILLSSEGCPRAMLIGRIEERCLDFKIGYKTIYRPKARVLVIIYGGLLGDLSQAHSEAFVSNLISSLACGEADLAILSNIAYGCTLHKLATTRAMFLCRDWLSSVNIHWRSVLPATFDEFLAEWKRSERKELRRRQKLLEKEYPGKVSFVCYQSKEDVARVCREAASIDKNSYHGALGVAFVDNIENRRRYTLCADRGWLRAYFLYVNEKPCAFQIATVYKNVIYFDWTGYDSSYKKFGPGIMLLANIWKGLCHDASIKEVDFGFGDAYHKHRFCRSYIQELDVSMAAPSLKGVRLNLARNIFLCLTRTCDCFLTRFGWRDKIKTIWRHRLRERL